MTLSIPCLIFMALVRSDVEPGLLRDTVLAALVAYLAVGGVDLGAGAARSASTSPTYWAPLTFGNTGNLGLPMALFAFGQLGFDMAVVIFAVMAILSFTFGVWVVAGGGNPVTAVREPLVWGTVARLGCSSRIGWRVPVWLGATLDLVGQMAIPLMLLTLGVAISRLKPRALGRARLAVLAEARDLHRRAAGGRPGLRPAEDRARRARAAGRDARSRSPPTCSRPSTTPRPDEVAGLVVVSTLMSVVAIPATLAFFSGLLRAELRRACERSGRSLALTCLRADVHQDTRADQRQVLRCDCAATPFLRHWSLLGSCARRRKAAEHDDRRLPDADRAAALVPGDEARPRRSGACRSRSSSRPSAASRASSPTPAR